MRAMDGHPVKLSGAAQSRLLVRRRTSSFVAKRATVPRLEASALPRPSTPYGHTQRAWTSPRGGADRERADLVGLDELMEALAADPQQFGNFLDGQKPLTPIRSGRLPIRAGERRY